MSELVDKVAKALFAYDQVQDESQLAQWNDDWKHLGEYYREAARIAIQTIRENPLASDEDDVASTPAQE